MTKRAGVIFGLRTSGGPRKRPANPSTPFTRPPDGDALVTLPRPGLLGERRFWVARYRSATVAGLHGIPNAPASFQEMGL
jgi:hypothetical protein